MSAETLLLTILLLPLVGAAGIIITRHNANLREGVTLLSSALKGKGAMAAQGGGQFTDIEVGRAVVHMANQAGAKFDVPKAPAAAAASAPN